MKEKAPMIPKTKLVVMKDIKEEEQTKDWEVQDLCHPEVESEAEGEEEDAEQAEEVTRIPHIKTSTTIILKARRTHSL